MRELNKPNRDIIKNLELLTHPGFKMLGCGSGCIVVDKTIKPYQVFSNQSGLSSVANPLLTFKTLSPKKLSAIRVMLPYSSKSKDLVKINETYFSGFRLSVLLEELLKDNQGLICIYQASKDYPLAIKVNDKEAFLAPHIVDSELTEKELSVIPEIKTFGVMI